MKCVCEKSTAKRSFIPVCSPFNPASNHISAWTRNASPSRTKFWIHLFLKFSVRFRERWGKLRLTALVYVRTDLWLHSVTKNKIFLLSLSEFYEQKPKFWCFDDVDFRTCCKLLDAQRLDLQQAVLRYRHLSWRCSKHNM